MPTICITLPMNYHELCKAAVKLDGNIEVAMVLSKSKLVASYLKSGGPAPGEDEFGKMISQMEAVLDMAKSNEDKFGDLSSIAIHYQFVDGLFFVINRSDTLVVGVTPPYDSGLADKISALLRK